MFRNTRGTKLTLPENQLEYWFRPIQKLKTGFV